MTFCKAIHDVVLGRSENKSFVHKNRDVYKTFALDIRVTAPNFQPFERLDEFEMHDVPSGGQGALALVMPAMSLHDVRRVIKE